MEIAMHISFYPMANTYVIIIYFIDLVNQDFDGFLAGGNSGLLASIGHPEE